MGRNPSLTKLPAQAGHMMVRLTCQKARPNKVAPEPSPQSWALVFLGANMPSYGNEIQAKTVEWYTPPEVFKALGMSNGIKFDVDVSSPGSNLVPWIPALRHITKDEDGLRAPWTDSAGDLGFVWCNPPWGSGLIDWCRRLDQHGRCNGSAVALVPARTDTDWWRRLTMGKCLVGFPKNGRVSFVTPSGKRRGNPGVGIALVGFGDRGMLAINMTRPHFCDVWMKQ